MINDICGGAGVRDSFKSLYQVRDNLTVMNDVADMDSLYALIFHSHRILVVSAVRSLHWSTATMWNGIWIGIHGYFLCYFNGLSYQG
jgi:hypothetical protein